MGLPACFGLAEATFPKVRHLASLQLAQRGWSQSRIARELGISQPMVSKYLAKPAPTDVLAQRLSADLVAQCTGAQPDTPWCSLLADQDPALQDLLAAEAWLLQENPIALVPQIGMNLAAGQERIYAYPARIVVAHDKLVAPAAPAPDEGHLARCLKSLQQKHAVGALISILGDAHIEQAARQAGWDIVPLPDGTDPDSRFDAAVHASSDLPDAFHDPGAHGIEPCLYIPAPTAQQAVHKMLQVNP